MIYILVPTFARINETKRFLLSLNKSINKDYLTIIVDDHPEKITFKNIKQSSSLKVISSEKELWWVGCMNLGIQVLLNDYHLNEEDIVVFANNDIEIDRTSFNNLLNHIKENNNQIVHPRTFDQNGLEVSSGAKIYSYFPYITIHPKKFIEEKKLIDMGTARFLMMSGAVLKKVRNINNNLIQYGGDNDFTLSAKLSHKINTYILRDAKCLLDNTQTGIKNYNIKTIRELCKSFFSIKSPNNIKYRYRLFKKFYGRIAAFFITTSMTLNTIVKFIFNKLIR
ncbi:MAG: hypothetical protein CMM96_03645 [Rickettsiales bacterium]|nr:hypothetical protein [Rickettsiales bacterium]